MKKLSKLKLNSFMANSLSEEEMNMLKGGDCSCACGCLYSGYGGSSTSSNANANLKTGSTSDWNIWVYCDGEWIKEKYHVPRDSDWG